MTQRSNSVDVPADADADVPEPARLRAGGSNDYGTLPLEVPLEETLAEHPVPEPSGPVFEGDWHNGEDGDGD